MKSVARFFYDNDDRSQILWVKREGGISLCNLQSASLCMDGKFIYLVIHLFSYLTLFLV